MEARNDWGDINKEKHLVEPLKAVKSLMHNQLQNDGCAGLTAYDSLKTLMGIRQQLHEDTKDYRKSSAAAAEVVEHIWIALGPKFQGMADTVLEQHFNTTSEAATDELATEAEKMQESPFSR